MTTEERVWPTLQMGEIHWMHPPSCLSVLCLLYTLLFSILIICFSTTPPRTNLNSAAAIFRLVVYDMKG